MIHTTLTDMFVLKLPLLEKISRPILVYLALIVLLRIFGKRELAQLNPFDLVVLLSKELLSESELLTVAHRQGFDGLDEVECCVLEPGGVFFMKGRIPSTDETRHGLIMARLDELDRKLDLIREGGRTL
jgi:uncharacterized membrane protein YcaP (DUF421 family)